MPLGDAKTAEKLLSDLVYDLRHTVQEWADLTSQTAQPRMGYAGQHLVSVITSLKGSRSGARGFDLVDVTGRHNMGEIKTCNKVDRLGVCLNPNCDGRVFTHEGQCPKCKGTQIGRKDDSKWLIGFSDESKFKKMLDPARYYLVLFALDDLISPKALVTKVWRVDPMSPGFALCLAAYYLPRMNKTNRAPFNLWPEYKAFRLMRPVLIYHSDLALCDGKVTTHVFDPTATVPEPILPLGTNLTGLTKQQAVDLAAKLGLPDPVRVTWDKPKLTGEVDRMIQDAITQGLFTEEVLAAMIAKLLYGDAVKGELTKRRLSGPFYNRLKAMA